VDDHAPRNKTGVVWGLQGVMPPGVQGSRRSSCQVPNPCARVAMRGPCAGHARAMRGPCAGHAMPCHAMPCHAMPCHAMPCHAAARHACGTCRCHDVRRACEGAEHTQASPAPAHLQREPQASHVLLFRQVRVLYTRQGLAHALAQQRQALALLPGSGSHRLSSGGGGHCGLADLVRRRRCRAGRRRGCVCDFDAQVLGAQNE
jgi:hypothetical protein